MLAAVEVQADELRNCIEERHRTFWAHSGIEVESRFWLTFEIGRRTWRS